MLYSKEPTSKKIITKQEKTFGEKENIINEQIEKEKEAQNKRKIKKDIDTALGIGKFSALGFGAMGWANGGIIVGIIGASIGCATLSFAADSGLFDNYEPFSSNEINTANLENQPLPIIKQQKSLNI